MAIDLDDATLVITANGYKAGTLYSLKPYDATGDATVTRATIGTRVNSSNLIETVANDVPRLDYTSVSCPVILIEPQSTNLFEQSEDIADAYWTKTRGAITSDSTTSPIVSVLADKFIPTAESGNHFIKKALSSPSNDTYTFSGYFKDNGYDLAVRITGFSFLSRVEFQVDLSNGATINFIESGTFTGSTKVTAFGDGWIKVDVMVNVPSGETSLSTQMFAYNGAILFVADGVSGFYLTGIQMEVQDNATSYIPTSGSTVTRNADVITVTGLTGTSTLTETFEDDTTNVIVDPTTYTMSEGRIKKVVRI